MLIQGVLFYNFSNKILVLLLLLLLYPRRDCYLQSLANAWWGLHYSYDTLVKLNSVMIALEKLKTTLQCFYLIFFLLLSWHTCSQFTLCAPSWARRPEKWSTSQIGSNLIGYNLIGWMKCRISQNFTPNFYRFAGTIYKWQLLLSSPQFTNLRLKTAIK